MKLLFNRWAAALVMAGMALAPVAAQAGDLETSFDRAFGTAPRTQRSPASILPAPSPVAQPAVRPAVLSYATPQITPRTYGSPLEAQIAALANAEQGRIGVAAIDLASGRTVTVLGDQPFPLASTSKIAIAAAFLQGVDDGRWRLTDQFPLMVPVPSRKYSSPTAPLRAGQMMSAQSLIELSITRSDNQATDALLAAVGGPAAVNRWMQQAGIAGFRLDRNIATLVRDDGEVNPAFAIDPRDSASPMAMTRLLASLYRGEVLSQPSRTVLLGAMERCETGRYRLRAQLPDNTWIAHKTGTLSNTSSDVGIIRTPDGHAFAVAVYVTGQGSKANRDAKIAELGRTIYEGYQAEASGNRRTASR
jgi:beta-lactamase class A